MIKSGGPALRGSNCFILEAVKAWIDPSKKDPRTVHHRGSGLFSIGGRTIRVASETK